MKINKNILVIGGSGFLASHVADKLLDDGYKITIFDEKKSKYLKKDQKFIKGNILDKVGVLKATKKIDVVYHFASVADIDKANRSPLNTLNINIFGTINIMEACIKNKVERIIFASSIYALSEQGGFYSTSKLSCEMIIEQYSKKYKIDFNILRFGSLYGLRSNYFNSLGKYIAQARKNKKIIRYSDGNEKRNYINVLDAASLCVKILSKKHKNIYYNLIGKKNIKVKNVLKIIAKKMGIKKITYKNLSFEHHYKTNPYTYRLRKGKLLIPKNEIKIEEGIKDIINKL
jgi:UDP-glucose 4-epimerase|tara:strand:- start:199 stop:1062 length:864 start_codon:yes stop_codon:yes gene_type:complete